MPLNIRPLSPELEAIAMKELNEVPERREEDVEHIRDWLKKQPHINADPEDQTLISFLRLCKFDLKKTKERIDTYYSLRTELPEFFKDRSTKDERLRELLHLGTFFAIPQTDSLGRRVLVGRSGHTDPRKHRIEDMMKLVCMMTDISLCEDDAAVICGTVIVMDLDGISLRHVWQYTPSLLRKMMAIHLKEYTILPQQINYVNNFTIFGILFRMIKPFLNEDIKKRLFMHGGSMESLYKNVPQELLPVEYGGNAGTTKELTDMLIEKFDSYSDWFEADATFGVDESKRPKPQQEKRGSLDHSAPFQEKRGSLDHSAPFQETVDNVD